MKRSGYRRGWFLRFPSYDTSFRTFSTPRQCSASRSSARRDRRCRANLLALRAGSVYTTIDALAAPACSGVLRRQRRIIGLSRDRLSTGRRYIRARVNAPAGGMIVLRKDGRIVAEHPLPEARFEANGERASIGWRCTSAAQPVPWIVSNPIYIHRQRWGTPPAPPPHRRQLLRRRFRADPWHIEKDQSFNGASRAAESTARPVEFTFQLGGGDPAEQYAALAISVGNALRGHTRLVFSARASQPIASSVQARQPQSGSRWKRSIYLDARSARNHRAVQRHEAGRRAAARSIQRQATRSCS